MRKITGMVRGKGGKEVKVLDVSRTETESVLHITNIITTNTNTISTEAATAATTATTAKE